MNKVRYRMIDLIILLVSMIMNLLIFQSIQYENIYVTWTLGIILGIGIIKFVKWILMSSQCNRLKLKKFYNYSKVYDFFRVIIFMLTMSYYGCYMINLYQVTDQVSDDYLVDFAVISLFVILLNTFRLAVTQGSREYIFYNNCIYPVEVIREIRLNKVVFPFIYSLDFKTYKFFDFYNNELVFGKKNFDHIVSFIKEEQKIQVVEYYLINNGKAKK